MANPQQRRKQKSKVHRAVRTTKQHSLKRQPAMRGPKAIQEAWDAKKTVRQNYAALGLAASLEPNRPGGTEDQERRDSPEVRPEPEASTALPKGFGRIIRDENGAVVRVEMGDAAETRMEVVLGPSEVAAAGRGVGSASRSSGTEVVRALERLASGGGRTPRHASAHEVAWLRELVAKHGGDVEGMARDRKLNVWQRTAGEIQRMIAKAGGTRR